MELMGQFDTVKETLDPHLWEDETLRPWARAAILKQLKKITDIKPVIFVGIDLIGSITRYQYSESSDIDVQLILAPQNDNDQAYWHKIFKATNGLLLEGTLHPINFFVVTSKTAQKFTGAKMPSGYDLITNTWIKRPKKPTYAQLHRHDISKPVINLEARAMQRQLAQYFLRPTAAEAKDIADKFRRWDLARKAGYSHSGARGGGETFANAMYKWLEKQFGSKPEEIYHAVRDSRQKS
jgi:hypothetical protein